METRWRVETKLRRKIQEMKISGNDDDDKIVTEFNGPRERAERLRLNQEKMKFSSMICDSIFNYLYL